MRSGVIELRSGQWVWTLEIAALGSKLVFRRWKDSEEEMVTWVPGKDITAEGAEEAARDPLHRTWKDSVGLLWQVSVEAVKPWRMVVGSVPPGEEGESLALVFARGWHKRAALVPKDIHLGELTTGELARYFEAAGPWM